MPSFNRVILIGRIVEDFSFYENRGKGSSRGSIAINREIRRKGGSVGREVCYTDIEIWGRDSEKFQKKAKKGVPVFVEGRLHLNTWEMENGESRQKLVVMVDGFQFLGGEV